MQPQVLDFLSKEKISALTTLIKDGMPHSAAMHFTHSDSPFELYFSTDNTSRKCEQLAADGATKAAVVIGFSEQQWVTWQASGTLTTITDPTEISRVQEAHYAKHPGSAKFKDDPNTVFLKFTPSWWRFTDFNAQPPAIIVG